MARFVLVHGSNHGAWCWRDVLPELTGLGHTADALDLPSVSPDPAALTGITLDDDANAIRAVLTGPTVLVGHSAAGYAISRAATFAPKRVTALVCPANGTGFPDVEQAKQDKGRDPARPERGQRRARMGRPD